MATIHVEVPEDTLAALDRSEGEVAQTMRLLAAMYWYGRGEISQGKAARIAGLTRAGFLKALAREQRDVFVVDFDSLRRELELG